MRTVCFPFLVWLALVAPAIAAQTSEAPAADETTAPVEKSRPEIPPAEDEGPGPATQATWLLNAGGTINLTEGNSSTRLYGITVNGGREGRITFFTFLGTGQYGVTRIPEKLPYPRGKTPQERAGTPGQWEFDENINNWLGQFKFGQYFSTERENYGFVQERADGNKFAGYWERYETQVGYGRKFIIPDWLQLNLEAGPNFSEEHQIVKRIRSRIAVGVSILATIKLSDRSAVTQDFSHQRTLASNNVDFVKWRDYRTRSTTALILQITQAFHLQTGLTVQHASVPAPGAHPLDLSVTNAILYALP